MPPRNFVLLKMLFTSIVLAFILNYSAFAQNTFNANFANVNFLNANKVHKVGTNGSSVGNITLYTNVITIGGQQIDCIVRTVSLTGGTFTLPNGAANGTIAFDYSSNSGSGLSSNQDRFFSPTFDFGNSGGSCRFSFQFILGGSYNNTTNTGTNINLENVFFNCYDIDGNGGNNSNQYTEIGDFSQLQILTGTGSNVSSTLNLNTNKTKFRSNSTSNTTDITADANRIKITFITISFLEILVGADGSGGAYYFLDFGPGPSWSGTPTTLSPNVLDLNTDNSGIDNSLNYCSGFSNFTAGGTNITNSSNAISQILLTIPTSQLVDGNNEILIPKTPTSTNDSIKLGFTSNGTQSFTLGGTTYNVAKRTGGGADSIIFTPNSGTFTTAQAERLLDSLRYFNRTNTIGTRSFSVSLVENMFRSSPAVFTVSVSRGTFNSTTQSACNNYTWNGTTYTTSGNYTFAYTNSSGCSSVDTLKLTIKPSTTSSTDITNCDSYSWNGNTYTASGTYTYITINAVGCDSIATLNLTISCDLSPIATDDNFTTNENESIDGNVSTNDTPSADGGNSWGLVTTTPNGILVFNNDGTFNYTPNAFFNGNDTFYYKICDANSDCDTAMVVITVIPVNNFPIATENSNATLVETPVNGDVSSNDTPSGDGGNIWSVDTEPNNGSIVFNTNGTYTYTPNPTFSGIDTFYYRLCDVDGDCDTAIVVITVSSPLPITLLDFKAVNVNNKSNLVTWSIYNQNDLSYFNLEKSYNGIDFQTAATKLNAGTTRYEHIDLFEKSARVVYYRLKMFENNGSYTYSKVIIVYSKITGSALNVYPNPIKDHINISISNDKNEIVQVVIYNVEGKKMMQKNFNLRPGQNLITIEDLYGYSNGIYWIDVISSGRKLHQKFIKQ